MIMEIGNLERRIALGSLLLTAVFNYTFHLVYPKSTLFTNVAPGLETFV